jgi:hypothetical protein
LALLTFRLSNYCFDSLFDVYYRRSLFSIETSHFFSESIPASSSVMPGGKSRNKARSVPATPEQHQEVDFDEEGEEADAEDQHNAKAPTVSLQQEVRDLSAKLNQVLGAVATLSKQVNAPSILQDAAGAQSAPGSVSGDSISSESAVPVYSGERLALCVGEADINLEHDPQFRHLSHQWNQAFERALREGSKSLKPTDRHKVNVLS